MRRISTYFILFSLLVLSFLFEVQAQVYTDGPIRVKSRLHHFKVNYVDTPDQLFCIPGVPPLFPELCVDSSWAQAEFPYKIWGLGNPNVMGNGWGTAGSGLGGNTLQSNFRPPQRLLSDTFNYVFYDQVFPADVPHFYDIKVRAFEDDLPSDWDLLADPLIDVFGVITLNVDCNSNSGWLTDSFDVPICCITGTVDCGTFPFNAVPQIQDGDDDLCDAEPYATGMDWRTNQDPCQWNIIRNNPPFDYLDGGCGGNFEPRVETWWEFVNGDSCHIPIDLDTMGPGMQTINHYNSNRCYTDGYAGQPGQDVFYEFTITQPVGLRFSTCAGTDFNTYLYLIDGCSGTVINENDSANCGDFAEMSQAMCDTGTYLIVVEGYAGDLGNFTLQIEEDPSLIVQADAWSGVDNARSCDGDSIPIGGNPAAAFGFPPYEYSWSLSLGGAEIDTVANPTVLPDSTITYFLTVTDSIGCFSIDTVVVFVDTIPQVDLGGDQEMCPGDTIWLDAGPGYFAYQWLPAGQGALLPQVNAVTEFGTQVVIVETDPARCQGFAILEITQADGPPLALPDSVGVCTGDTVVLDASGGTGDLVYFWDGIFGPDTLAIFATGEYTIEKLDSNFPGCVSYDTTYLVVYANPAPNLPDQMTLCAEDAPLLLDPGLAEGPSYAWAVGASDSTIISTNQYYEVEADEADLYFVTITTSEGNCSAVDSVQVVVVQVPEDFTLGETGFICPGEIMTLTAPPGFDSYRWSTSGDDTLSTLEVMDAGIYSVTATYGNGDCEIERSISLTEECPEDLFIPDVFSPNADGVNEEFKITGPENVSNVLIHIYNRWGSEVWFNTENPDGIATLTPYWDGKKKGSNKHVPEGVYFYTITYKTGNSEEVKKRGGNVTVLSRPPKN